MTQRKTGFTLVEILAVLVIIGSLGIVSTIAVPAQMQKARDAVRKGDVYLIAEAIAEYQEDSGCYPDTLPQCGYDLTLGDSVIMENIPCDPRTGYSYVYVSDGGVCPSWFQVYGNLEYTKDAIIDRLGCRDGCGPDCQFNYGAASPNQKLDPYPCVAIATIPEEDLTVVEEFVCAPGGHCVSFLDPIASGCPDIYPDDPTCQDACSDRRNRCHDSRGK